MTFNDEHHLEPDDDDWNDLHGIVMGRDYSETIDDLIRSPGGPPSSYVFIAARDA